MKFVVKAFYSEKIIRASVFSYWKKKLGGHLFWAVPVAVLSALVIWKAPEDWHFASLFLVPSSIGIFAATLAYFVHLKRSLRLFSELGERECEWRFDDEGFAIKSCIGETKLKWFVLKEILRFPEHWLFVFKSGACCTLPSSDVPQDCADFIEAARNKLSNRTEPDRAS